MDTWIVLVEAATTTPQAAVEPTAVESLLTFFADESPVGLYAPDRYALQVWKVAERAEQAMTDVLDRWRVAVAQVGLDRCQLVRAEIMTPAEMNTETQGGSSNGTPAPTHQRLEAMEAVQEARRAVLRARSATEATRAVVRLVHRLGGSVVLAEGNHPYGFPIDLSFGQGRRLWPAAVPYTTSRALLEEHLPPVVDDAWCVLTSPGVHGPGGNDHVLRHHADVEVVRDRTLAPNWGWRA